MSDGRILGVLVVDDEPPARALLREYVEATPGYRVLAECANGFEAVRAASELAPDVLLLDVQMPKLDGFEVLELLEGEPLVIFTTAYEEYALHAFRVHAVDYLLKPFTGERLAEALARARHRLERHDRQPLEALAAEHRRQRRPLDRVLVRDGARIHVLAAAAIDFIEARDDYVLIQAEGQRHRKKQTLGELEELLDPDRFVRVHRGFLVNVERIERLELYAKDSRIAFLAGGARVPVSRSGYTRLRVRL